MRTHYDDRETSLQIHLVWNPNAIKGYAAAIGIMGIVLAMTTCTSIEPPEPIELPNTTGVQLLIFGDGDGTGARKGNLTAEGRSQRGKESTNPLDDATKASASNATKTAGDPSQTNKIIPSNDVGGRGNEKDDGDAIDRIIGKRDGSDDGTGLGGTGTGRGKGLGNSDIDWGGGGNRIVLQKVMPDFPTGTWNTEVKLRFRVRSDGTVAYALPVRKGNPAVDNAAIRAMMQWRFNKLGSETEMEGFITFVFRNS